MAALGRGCGSVEMSMTHGDSRVEKSNVDDRYALTSPETCCGPLAIARGESAQRFSEEHQ